MQARSGNDKANVVASAPARAACHLLQLRSTQLPPTTAGSRVGNHEDNCARGKIDSRSNGRSSENCIKQAGAHQLLNNHLPGRNVSGVMRSDSAADDCVPVTVTTYFRMLLNPTVHKLAPRLTTFLVSVATHQRGFRCRLIATTASWHEYDGR